MKKLLAILLMLAMCLTFAVAEETTNEDLLAAKSYLYFMYKNAPETLLRGFDRVAVVNIGGVAYPVTWTASSDKVTITTEGNTATINIDEKPAAEYAFTLTATISDGKGESVAVNFNHKVEAVASTGVVFVENPEVGVAYKFALNQNNLATPATLYLTGEMSGNYLATSDNVLDAVDVYLEKVEGGYYVYFMAGEAKKYVNITTYAKDDGSLKNTQKIEDAPSVPYTWDAERGTMVADLGELGKFYMGTYSSYTTISTSNVSYIEDVSKIGASQFPAGFATVTPELAKKPEAGKAYVFALQQNALATPAMLYLTGEMSGNYLATSDKLADAIRVYLEETEGGYYLFCLKDGVKNYINITTYAKNDGSLKNTQKIEAAPSVPYTWDAERGTLVGDLGDLGKFYMGTYSTYNTISTSNVSYIEDVTKIGVSQFPAGLYDLKLPAEEIPSAVVEEAAPMTVADIMAAAFALEVDKALPENVTLTGKITEIETEYSAQYKNISVIIVVEGFEDKPLLCHRAKGDGVADLAVGDVITLEGPIKNYKGTIEFDKATVTNIVKGK